MSTTIKEYIEHQDRLVEYSRRATERRDAIDPIEARGGGWYVAPSRTTVPMRPGCEEQDEREEFDSALADRFE